MTLRNSGFGQITDLPRADCAWVCGRRFRVYVEVSRQLNERIFDGSLSGSGLGLYVFKVGSTRNCKDRWKNIRQNRKAVAGKPGLFKEPAYAGVG